MTLTPEWVSAIASSVAAIGVFLAFYQLLLTKNVAQLQFEDSLSKEYRELMERIPTKALLGESLSDAEYEKTFDEFFRYIDLTNEQVSLRERHRISMIVWNNWSSGIQANLALPSFNRAWVDIKNKSSGFQELRRLETESFKIDPAHWK